MPTFYTDWRQWMIPGCVEVDYADEWEAKYLCVAVHILCFTFEWDITLWKKAKTDA